MRRRPLLPKRVSSPAVPPWGLLWGGLYNLHALPPWVSCLLHDERVEAHFSVTRLVKRGHASK